MLVVLSLVQGVDDLSDACRDISDSAATFDGVVHSLLSVVLSDRSCLSVIDTEALLDGLEVVIATAALFTALQQALDEFVFGVQQSRAWRRAHPALRPELQCGETRRG